MRTGQTAAQAIKDLSYENTLWTSRCLWTIWVGSGSWISRLLIKDAAVCGCAMCCHLCLAIAESKRL